MELFGERVTSALRDALGEAYGNGTGLRSTYAKILGLFTEEPKMETVKLQVGHFAPDPKTQSTSADVRGRTSTMYANNPSGSAGCRLGCACSQHKPLRAPYVPTIDDWDLLPDA